MAGVIAVTNPKKKRGKKKKRSKARKNPRRKKRRRNPGKGFIGRWFNNLGHDGGLAIANLGGRYVGEVAGALGDKYLGETIAGFAGTAGQVAIHLALFKFAGRKPWANQVRIGLLSQAIHEVAVDQLGVDAPGMVLDLFAEEKAPAEEGAEGLGVLSEDRLETKLAGRGTYRNPYLEAYG